MIDVLECEYCADAIDINKCALGNNGSLICLPCYVSNAPHWAQPHGYQLARPVTRLDLLEAHLITLYNRATGQFNFMPCSVEDCIDQEKKDTDIREAYQNIIALGGLEP